MSAERSDLVLDPTGQKFRIRHKKFIQAFQTRRKNRKSITISRTLQIYVPGLFCRLTFHCPDPGRPFAHTAAEIFF
jgi:hypothetical protein